MVVRRQSISSLSDTVTVAMLAVGTWFFVGTPIAIHFTTLDIPVPLAVFAGWSFGGVVTAFMDIANVASRRNVGWSRPWGDRGRHDG